MKGYEITRDGRVLSVGSNWRGYGKREMKQHIDTDGYMIVRLTTNGNKRKNYRVHTLVASQFLPKKKPGQQLRHLDGNKQNNKATNLKWGTAKENAADRELHGRTSRGKKHSDKVKQGLLEALKSLVTDAEDRGETRRSNGRLYDDFKAAYKAIARAEGRDVA